MKLNLKDVTVLCVDHLPVRGVKTVARCLHTCDFAAAKVLTHEGDDKLIYHIPRIGSISAYSRFCLANLQDHFETSHCLVVQHDGYVLNGLAWDDQFLAYDYVGAPWADGVVGNGGFSLRSRRLVEATARLGLAGYVNDTYEDDHTRVHPHEDYLLCRAYRPLLEQAGVRFAPRAVAARFSAENTPWTGQFGFHGLNTGITPCTSISELATTPPSARA